MKTIDTIAEMQGIRHQLVEPVGFVPTMGHLHEGHLSLVKHARAENATVVVSIFVNPTQFGHQEDFQQYPRDIERDLALLEKENTDIVFTPSTDEMYPPDFNSRVEVKEITEPLEGAARPGHFRGVTTVVAKLFNIVQPDRAYFGQKDAQQALVIHKMVADLNLNLGVVTLPTIREPDGLAMSSRNSYLNPEERRAAPVLYRSLKLAEQRWGQGTRDAARLREEMKALIQKEPRVEIDYISIADAVTLEELDEIKPPALVSLAVRIGKTRLIDNIVL